MSDCDSKQGVVSSELLIIGRVIHVTVPLLVTDESSDLFGLLLGLRQCRR